MSGLLEKITFLHSNNKKYEKQHQKLDALSKCGRKKSSAKRLSGENTHNREEGKPCVLLGHFRRLGLLSHHEEVCYGSSRSNAVWAGGSLLESVLNVLKPVLAAAGSSC